MHGLYYGFWDYWQLYHKVTFDGVNRLILINDGVTSLDVQIDIYSAWKEWSQLETNLKYLKAIDTVGGEPTVGSERLDVTYFLINGWKLKPYPGTYDLTVVGNLFDINGASIKVNADISPFFSNNITLNLNTSVIVRQLTPVVTISGSGLSESEAQTLTDISSSVNTLTGEIYNISGSIIEIRNIFCSPVTASLVSSQETALFDIQNKLTELWKLHGLEVSSPIIVSSTGREVDDIVQVFSEQPDGSIIVTRN